MGIRLAATKFFAFIVAAIAPCGAAVVIQFDASYNSPVTVDRTVNGGTNWFMQDPGQFRFILQPGSPADVPLSFYTFCIEPREFLSPGQVVTYSLAPLEQGTTNIGGMGAARANAVRELLGRYYPDFSIAVNVETGAAIQAALWEIIRETAQTIGTYDLGTGDVQYRTWSDTGVRDLSQAMLSSLTGTGPMVNTTGVQALILAGGTQDTLVQFSWGGYAGSVPEPTTTLTLGAGLLALGLLRRRKST